MRSGWNRSSTRKSALSVASAIGFANGAIGTVNATTTPYPGRPGAIELIGTKGPVRIAGTALITHFHDGSEGRLHDSALGSGAGADATAFPNHHHRAMIADYLTTIETGGEPKVTRREALKVHKLVDTLLRSAASGRREAV